MTNTDYSKQMEKMVASTEFCKILGKDAGTHIIKYSDLEDKTDINEVIPESRGYRIVLIETKHNTGHWCCITRNNENFIWFDQEFEFIPVKMQQILDEQGKPLTRLLTKLKHDGGCWNYNTVKFQQMKDNINTCGRHCCLYLYAFLQGLNLKEYQKEMVMEKQKTGLSFDELVCECTKQLN